MGLYYLLGRKQAKSDCFQKLCTYLKFGPLKPLTLSGSAIDDPPLAVEFFCVTKMVVHPKSK